MKEDNFSIRLFIKMPGINMSNNKNTISFGMAMGADDCIEERKSIESKNKNNPLLPTNIKDYWIYFKSEVRKRWPEAKFPNDMTGKDRKQLRLSILDYEPEDVVEMIKVLVWDWEAVRCNCFPFMKNRPIPTIENLWKYHHDLFSCIGIGMTDTRESRVSNYKRKYVEDNKDESDNDGGSMLDLFRANNR